VNVAINWFKKTLRDVMTKSAKMTNIVKFALIVSTGVSGLELVKFSIPDHAIQGENVELLCDYDLQGDKLYSVKWYRNGQEFYRYIPTDNPSTAVFRHPGLYINEYKSTETKIYLRNVDHETTGLYRCEISGEAPLFQTASQETVLVVVNLPDEGPIITGSSPRYQVGDQLNISCYSRNSLPAAKLKWYINGEEADTDLLGEYVIKSDVNKLETSRLDLKFRLKTKHYRKGDLKIKCTASIATIYWKSNEESIQVVGRQSQYSQFESQVWSTDFIMKSSVEQIRLHTMLMVIPVTFMFTSILTHNN